MNLFPIIRDHEPIPWWAGIAYARAQTRDYRCAPIPINWIIAWAKVLHVFLNKPHVALGIMVKREQIDRLMKTQLENYRLKIELGDTRVALTAAEKERDRLQAIFDGALSERLTPEARKVHEDSERQLFTKYAVIPDGDPAVSAEMDARVGEYWASRPVRTVKEASK